MASRVKKKGVLCKYLFKSLIFAHCQGYIVSWREMFKKIKK